MVHFQRLYPTMTRHCDGFALQVTHALLLAALLIFGQEILSPCAGKPCVPPGSGSSTLTSRATTKHTYT